MNPTQERWLPIPGYEGSYKVSDHGRVWSSLSERALNPSKRRHGGYRVVTLKRRQWAVHKLVLLAFVGPCPDGMEVCHEDGDPENNHLWNLRYDTHDANVQDRRVHGTHPRGIDLGIATRLSEDDVRRIRQLHADGLSYRKIGDLYAVDRLYIRRVVKRSIWAWVDNPELEAQSWKYGA